MTELPSLFVSHGAPTLYLSDEPAARFLRELGSDLPRPEAIVVVSAHTESPEVVVGGAPAPATIHDFYGFPKELYEHRYPAGGAPELAARVVDRLKQAGVAARLDPNLGLDHGAWVPLTLMYPEADVPVVPVSLVKDAAPAEHLAVGAALRPLREEGVLILASGAATHNLAGFRRFAADAPALPQVTAFAEWLADTIGAGRTDELLAYRERAPHAAWNHPTDEHFLPLFVAAGAGTPGVPGRRVHRSVGYGMLAMDAYAFD